jgi:Rrf2 family protein
MKLITRNTDYAVRALCYIAKAKDKLVSVPELVGALKMPRPFLRKILQALNKKKILKSHKGSGGGFSLAAQPEKVFLADIIKIFQGKLQLNECLFRRNRCPNIKGCSLRKKIQEIEHRVVKDIGSINLANLLR